MLPSPTRNSPRPSGREGPEGDAACLTRIREHIPLCSLSRCCSPAGSSTPSQAPDPACRNELERVYPVTLEMNESPSARSRRLASERSSGRSSAPGQPFRRLRAFEPPRRPRAPPRAVPRSSTLCDRLPSPAARSVPYAQRRTSNSAPTAVLPESRQDARSALSIARPLREAPLPGRPARPARRLTTPAGATCLHSGSQTAPQDTRGSAPCALRGGRHRRRRASRRALRTRHRQSAPAGVRRP